MFPGRALLTYDDYNFRFCNGRASSRSLLWSVVVSASSRSLFRERFRHHPTRESPQFAFRRIALASHTASSPLPSSLLISRVTVDVPFRTVFRVYVAHVAIAFRTTNERVRRCEGISYAIAASVRKVRQGVLPSRSDNSNILVNVTVGVPGFVKE